MLLPWRNGSEFSKFINCLKSVFLTQLLIAIGTAAMTLKDKLADVFERSGSVSYPILHIMNMVTSCALDLTQCDLVQSVGRISR